MTAEITWVCSCNFVTSDAHLAFLHRDGTPAHQVTPQVANIQKVLEAKDAVPEVQVLQHK